MVIGVKIDFENIYKLNHLTSDCRQADFNTMLKNKQTRSVRIDISKESHPLMSNVFNLAFGPLNEDRQIDDMAELAHEDYSKVFSTILFTALTYLTSNPDHYLGIDGSDNNRAYYYGGSCKEI